MPSGGYRPGGGRPRGALTKRTQKIAIEAAERGITPLQVMLDNMNFAHETAGALLVKIIDKSIDKPDGWNMVSELLKYRQIAQEAAKDAAPYMHPRLATVEVGNKGGEAFKHEQTVIILPPNGRD